jgi:hypothetical protein
MKIMLPSLRQVAPLPFHQPNGFKLVTGLGQEVDRSGAAWSALAMPVRCATWICFSLCGRARISLNRD